MSLLKNFEFNKVNKGVEEEIKYLQLPNKIKYFAFWGSVVASTLISYNYVTSNLTSVSQKASLNKGDAPIVAFFETNWEKKANVAKEDYKESEKILNEKSQLLKQLNGDGISQTSINVFIQTLNDEDILNLIKGSSDFKNMVILENKFKLISSKQEITLNGNSYKIVDILDKLASLDDETRLTALEEPVAKILELKILDTNKSDLKALIIELLNDTLDFNSLKYKTSNELLNASLLQVKRGNFELPIETAIAGGAVILLNDSKSLIEKKYQISLEENGKKLADAKNKVETLKKEVEALESLQAKRIEFIGKVGSITTLNYFDNKAVLKTLFDEIN